MEDGSYKLLGDCGRVLGFVLVKKGAVKSFTPQGLTVVKLNEVFADVNAGRFEKYSLKKVDSRSQPPSDAHSFYVNNTNRREAWRLRKERKDTCEHERQKEEAKLERKLRKKEVLFV